MGYYMGDFYPNHQRVMKGDPGFFSFLGGIAKSAVGFIPGVGPIAEKALSIIPKFGGGGRLGGLVKRGGAIIKAHPVLSAAGAAGAIGAAGLGAHELRMHMGKRGVMVHGRRRRMRVTNPKALRRALRRADGFARFAMHCIRLTHPHKKGKFGGFRMKRKKSRV